MNPAYAGTADEDEMDKMKLFYDVEFEGTLVSLLDDEEYKDTVQEVRRPWQLKSQDVEAASPEAAVTLALRAAWDSSATLWIGDEAMFYLAGSRDYPRLEVGEGKPVDSFASQVPYDRILRLNKIPALFDVGGEHV